MGLYGAVTTVLGTQRRFVRRVAALCLIWMGVHGAADRLDDLIYQALDVLDLFLDDAVASMLESLAGNGALLPVDAARFNEAFATWIDLAEKNRMAMALALAAELVLDVVLLGLVWGRHGVNEASGAVHAFRQSVRDLGAAFVHVDAERVLVVPTFAALALIASGMAGAAVESVVRTQLAKHLPELLLAGTAAAAMGILFAALLLVRFLPDLLQGALLASQARAAARRARDDAKHAQGAPLWRHLHALRTRLRGTLLFGCALALALHGLRGSAWPELIARTEPSAPIDDTGFDPSAFLRTPPVDAGPAPGGPAPGGPAPGGPARGGPAPDGGLR